VSSDTEDLSLLEFMKARVPYWGLLELELKEVASGSSVFECPVRDSHMQNGVVHGGVLASIADSACAVAGISLVFPSSYATTINLQLSYLKPVSQGILRAEGKCLRAGKSLLFSEARVFNSAGELICTASSQLMIVPVK
jgi:uncharacterized protein (TIGR00369 family)